MLRLGVVVSFVVLVSAAPQGINDAFLKGTTELEFALMIHRHGDRTPVKSNVHYGSDPAALTKLTEPYGWGQLTDVGKRRAFALGEEIDSRYGKLISPKYNYSEIYIRSTDSTRTKMSVLAALANIYPGPSSWNNKLHWEPIPYTTVPAKYDFILSFLNCPNYIAALRRAYAAKSPVFDPYQDTLALVARKTGFDFTAYPVLIFSVYDVYVSQLSLGLPLDPEIQAVFPEIKKAADIAFDILLGDNQYTYLGGGVLLNEFLTYAKKVASGVDTQKIRIYSAHDVSVYAFEAVTQIADRQGVPKYSSLYSLELRRVKATGKYVVVPVYIPSPGEKPVFLRVSGCGDLCTLEEFAAITSPFARDVDTWRSECGFTNDLVVDEADIA